jgi:hypothetical protein
MSKPTFGADKPDLVELRESGQLWDDFYTFAAEELACQDVDPAYPVLRELQAELGAEDRLWHTFLYVAFYNLGSAVEAFAHVNHPATLPDELAKLPTGIERRGLRTVEAMNHHLSSIVELRDEHGSLGQWLQAAFELPDLDELREIHKRDLPPEEASYLHLREILLRQPWNNGRWAAYKTAEILQKVNGYPIRATDMGNDDSSGPVSGLKLLWGDDKPEGISELDWLDELGEATQARLRDNVHPNIEIDEVETLLCDFHSLAQGHYYVGHDIDMMAEQLMKANPMWVAPVWRARSRVFRVEDLAERRGEPPYVDAARRKAYSDHGILLLRSQTRVQGSD